VRLTAAFRAFGAALACVALVALSPSASAARAEPSARDWKTIRQVIGDQRAALRKDDAARAFGFASRGLRAQFESAENFMRMVHDGYQPLIDARRVEFLEGAVIDGQVIQPLRLVLADDTVLVALYTMLREDGGRWRIAGCMIAPSTVRST